MNANETLRQLQEQLAEMQKEMDPAERDALVKAVNEERNQAVYRAEESERAASKAKEELEKIKSAIQWTMGCLLISDILMFNMVADEVPASADGFLPFNYCPEDTARIEWINKIGRTGANPNGFTIVLPCNVHNAGQESIPEIYNIRHIIDVARKHPAFQGALDRSIHRGQ